MFVMALVPEIPKPIPALGELIGGVVGFIVTAVELLEPDVPVLAPLFEGEPSRMVSRDTPGDTDGVAGVLGLATVAAEAPLSICNLNSLGAEGSSRSCSTGEIAVVLGASDEPGAVVVLVDGTPLGVPVAGLVVALGVAGVVVVWARAGAAAAKPANTDTIRILFMPLSFFVAPWTANFLISSWFLEHGRRDFGHAPSHLERPIGLASSAECKWLKIKTATWQAANRFGRLDGIA